MAKFTAINTAAAYGSCQIGQMGQIGTLTSGQQDMAHGALGGTIGAVLNPRKPLQGALAGGIGAVVGERATKAMVNMDTLPQEAAQKVRETGLPLTSETQQAAAYDIVNQKTGIATVMAASTTALLTNNPNLVNTAIFTAQNALDYNFLPSASFEINQTQREIFDAASDTLIAGGEAIAETAEDIYNNPEEYAKDAALAFTPYGAIGEKIYNGEEVTKLEIAVETGMTFVPVVKVVRGGAKTGGKILGKVGEKFVKKMEKAGKAKNKQFTPSATTNPKVDYSTPEVAFSLRIDPVTGKGPMHIDARQFTSATSYTSEGSARNSKQFWKLWNEKYPGTLSGENLKDIKKGISPVVDQHWINSFPEHSKFFNQTLEHHHLNHNFLTVPLPKGLHNGKDTYKIWHSLGTKNKQ